MQVNKVLYNCALRKAQANEYWMYILLFESQNSNEYLSIGEQRANRIFVAALLIKEIS